MRNLTLIEILFGRLAIVSVRLIPWVGILMTGLWFVYFKGTMSFTNYFVYFIAYSYIAVILKMSSELFITVMDFSFGRYANQEPLR